ncbi:MAG: DUF4012 domain-containing protein, partial [Candidatus Moranbacteria bacterium]|nr:DUF4012 domain-containing protein [Candidatus Moranbacteria bacterium]
IRKGENHDSGTSQEEARGSLATFAKLAKNILDNRGREMTFLILLQNNMEIRPGGGFIGSFAIIKTKGEDIVSYEVHDTGNFDERIPDTSPMPYPMGEIFGISAWKLRDSNYSPDFKVNAEKAMEFYYLGKGLEQFDGVIALNVSVLEKILEITGPIELEGFPGIYDSKNVLINLEKQVEIDFEGQGITRGDRKQVLGTFFKELLKKIGDFSILDKTRLFKVITGELENKNIQLYFKDYDLQKIAQEADWTGEVDKIWDDDYLMAVDANLGAYKSDYFVRRSMDYFIDFSGEKPKATLRLKYNHTAKEKNWFTKDYQSYLRIYVPEGSELVYFDGAVDEPRTGSDLGKTYFGGLIKVETGKEKTIEIAYNLPEKISYENYALKIQKQSGLNDILVKITVKTGDGQAKVVESIMSKNAIIEDLK